MDLGKKYPKGDVPFLSHYLRSTCYHYVLLLVMLNLISWLKWRLPGFLSIISYYFPFAYYIPYKQVIKSSPFSREGDLAFASWRKECQRICRHMLKALQ